MREEKELISYEMAKKGMRILLTLFVITFLIILIFSIVERNLSKGGNFIHSFKNINLLFFIIQGAVWYLTVLFFSLFLREFSKIFHIKLSIFFGIELFLSGLFLASFTPFGGGGLPYQIYLLTKKNLKTNQAFLLLFFFGTLKYVFVFLFFLFFLFYGKFPFLQGKILKIIRFWVILISSIALFIVIFIFSIREKVLLNFIEKIKDRKTILFKFFHFIVSESIGFKKSFFILFHFKTLHHFLKGTFFLFISTFLYISLTPLSFLCVGQKEFLLNAFSYQVLTMLLLLYNPMPGGIGAQEGIGILLFKSLLSPHILPVFILLWRFFNFYIAGFTGSFFILYRLKKGFKDILES